MSLSHFSKSSLLLQSLGISALLATTCNTAQASSVVANFNSAHKLYIKWTKDQKPEYLFEAMTHLHNAEAQDPKNPVVLQWIGYIYILQHNYALAIDPLTRVANRSHHDAQPYINLGYSFYKLARYTDAVGAFRKAEHANSFQLSKNPKRQLFRINRYQIYSNLGSSLFHTQDYPGSIAAFRTAMNANRAISSGASTNIKYRELNLPSRTIRKAHIQDGLGAALAATGNITEALKSFESASRLQPGNTRYTEDLGKAYANAAVASPVGSTSASAMWENASHTDAEALKLDPNNYQLQEAYGIALVEQHKDHEAVDQFESAAHKRSSNDGAGSPGFDVLFHHGEACINTGHTSQAETLFLAATKLKPKDATAWQWAGYAALQQGNNPSAIAYLQNARTLEPDSPKILLNLGMAQFKNGNFKDAEATYTDLTRVSPDSATAYYSLGNACVKAGGMQTAAAAYEQAVKLDPASVAIPKGLAYVGLGYSLLHTGDIAQAQVAYSHALSIDPNNVDASTGYALASTQLARSSTGTDAWATAAVALHRATSLDPTNNDLRIAYGEALLRSHRDSKAQSVLLHAVDTSPKNEVALKLLARSQQNQGDIAGETKTLSQLVAAEPDNIQYRQLLANAQMVQLDYSGAASTLTTIVRDQPNNLSAAFQLYTALSHTGHEHQALMVLQDASKRSGPAAQKAVIFNALGDETYSSAHKNDNTRVKAAQRYFYEALSANHHSNDALRGLGVTALKLGAYKHAILFLTRALAINPDDAPTYVARGYAYEQMQQIKAAIADYRRALKLDPQNAQARANLQRFAIVPKS